MITIQASVSKGWLHQNGGFVFEKKYYMDPLYRLEEDRRINQFIRERFPQYALYNMEDNLVQSAFYHENLVQIGAIQPNMILAVLLGSEFSFFGDKDADVKGLPLQHISDAKSLPPIDHLSDHPLIKSLTTQIIQIQNENPELTVIPPFFWDLSGRATIHGIITTSLKLVGENMMMLLMLDPDLSHAIHQWIVDAYIYIIRYFANLTKLDITSVHVGECSGAMLSPDLFGEFVVPYITQLGKSLGGVRIHSCGNSNHLVSSFCKIENLQTIDTGSGTSVRIIREIAEQNVEVNVFPPVHLLLKGSPSHLIKEWLYNVLAENGGGDLKIAYHMEHEYDMENCLFIHDELERLGHITPGRLY